MTARLFEPRYGRLEDLALLTGKGRYVDDIHLPGMLEVAFVRSPHGHATFSSIDTSAALCPRGLYVRRRGSDVDL